MSMAKVISEELKKVKIDKGQLDRIKDISNDFLKEIKNKLNSKKIKAEVFIGGSLAKNTLIKTDKDKYDVDVFVRFDSKYDDKISEMLGDVLGKEFKKIHGSRDYYQKHIGNITLEVIPVIKINKPSEAKNITDLSYFHVNYVLKKVKKNKKIGDEIMIAKAFCHANDCYGAESYIRGFSGYALELLIINYKTFLNFVKAVAKDNNEKTVIDMEKSYKNKKEVLIELNESKLLSPIVLVDPTFSGRNALSSLSSETFEKFKKSCREFLKNPSEEFFRKKNVENEFKNIKDVKKIKIRTNKQVGDIAGTKSKKFFNFFINEIKREFKIKKSGFDYDENENIAVGYLVVEKKNEEIVKGPAITMVEHLERFRKKHPDAFIKNQVCYAKIKHKMKFEDFFKIFLKKNIKIIEEMGVSELKII
ncbi:nucleotidyltransferase domain-containing protein [Candidatus Pacearchaeota archaeon]|nr:nucleotidyltransferase domain-containing protein [Candidatus Pacearchaeota archaeon]